MAYFWDELPALCGVEAGATQLALKQHSLAFKAKLFKRMDPQTADAVWQLFKEEFIGD